MFLTHGKRSQIKTGDEDVAELCVGSRHNVEGALAHHSPLSRLKQQPARCIGVVKDILHGECHGIGAVDLNNHALDFAPFAPDHGLECARGGAYHLKVFIGLAVEKRLSGGYGIALAQLHAGYDSCEIVGDDCHRGCGALAGLG